MVNSVQDIVRFVWTDDGHLFPSTVQEIAKCLTQSGWSKTYDVLKKTYNYPCTYYTAASTVTFANPIFCIVMGGYQGTWSEYQPSEVTGLSDGSYEVDWNVYLEGGCTNLLSQQESDW